MRVKTFLSFLILINLGLRAQNTAPILDNYYSMLRSGFHEKDAYTTTGFVEQRWRLAGNTGFNESIFYVEKILQAAGFKKEVNGEADGELTYRIEERKMKEPTWEPVDGSVSLAGESMPLLKFQTNRNMLAISSASTPPAGETAELVYVGEGTDKDFEGKDLKGKIVMGDASAWRLYGKSIAAGAIGVLAYSVPSYNQPEKNVNSIQFQRIGYTDSVHQKWAVMLSYAVREKLLAALKKGSPVITVKVVTRIYNANEYTLIANARGSAKPDERFVFSAHVQEPGANDNATGVGALAEMARLTADLIQQKKFSPQRTITFLWGDEIVSTRRYITEDSIRAKGIRWGLSLDMVGEDVTKTGGSFLIEKMPDPSAIWTRGNDKHTEWGGSVLKESDLFPHYFTDFLLDRCRQQAVATNWVVNANPFEGGSDHTPFLEAHIPGLLMWHFTDMFYHTDADRLDMVSPTELKNVGVSGLAAAFTLSSADEATSLALIKEIQGNAQDRLATEYTLSKAAVKQTSALAYEQHILDTWTKWYATALDRMQEINVNGTTEKIRAAINDAKDSLLQQNKSYDSLLEKKE